MPKFVVRRKRYVRVWEEASFEVEAEDIHEAEDKADDVDSARLDFLVTDSDVESIEDEITVLED